MGVVEIETQDHQKRYVVIDDEGVLVEPVVRYLKYLDRIGVVRNTLRYCAQAVLGLLITAAACLAADYPG